MDVSQIIVWLIVGALTGTLIGRVAKGSKSGYGIWKNLGIGLIGAVIGGFLFNLLNIDWLKEISISANDILAAVVGALIFLGILAVIRKKNAKPAA